MATHYAPRRAASSTLVVVLGLDDNQLIISCAVDETMFVVDPPRPESGQIPAQLLRLPSALEWRATCFLDQTHKTPQHLLVG
jgi:hypothetical protein